MYSETNNSLYDNNAWKAFDGKFMEGSWGDALWAVAANSSSLIYEFKEPILAYKFKYQVSTGSSAYNYSKFSIQASNDGINWTDLTPDHEITKYREITTFEESPQYNSNNIKRYKMFRIYIKEINEALKSIFIGEFEIYGIK